MSEINARQKKFADEYVINGVAETAALNAGYSKNYARSQAYKLLSRPNIRKEIERKLNKQEEIKNRDFERRTVILDKGVYEFIRQHVNSYDDLSEVVNQMIIKSLPSDAESLDKWLELNKRQSVSESVRYEVLHKAGFRCEACGDSPRDNKDCKLEIDHIIPYSLGGLDHITNYQSLCKRCNTSKSNRYAIDHR